MTAHQPIPSYAKLILWLIVIVLGILASPLQKVIEAWLNGTQDSKSQVTAHRLFDEYPVVAGDVASHPDETRAALWVSFRHLSGAERSAAQAKWQTSRLRPLADGLYRLDCSGPSAAAFGRVLARYPYAVAPGAATDPALAAAYRRVAGTSPFRVCVVRGEWLIAALADEPATAQWLGVQTSPSSAEQYLDAVVTNDTALTPFAPELRGRVAVPPTITRRALEAADGSGLSLFVRWATATGVGVPVY